MRTSDVPGASTSANVHLELVGAGGASSGRRLLLAQPGTGMADGASPAATRSAAADRILGPAQPAAAGRASGNGVAVAAAGNNGEPFARGGADAFDLACAADLGELAAVVVGHDGRGAHAGWHLEQVRVRGLGPGAHSRTALTCHVRPNPATRHPHTCACRRLR